MSRSRAEVEIQFALRWVDLLKRAQLLRDEMADARVTPPQALIAFLDGNQPRDDGSSQPSTTHKGNGDDERLFEEEPDPAADNREIEIPLEKVSNRTYLWAHLRFIGRPMNVGEMVEVMKRERGAAPNTIYNTVARYKESGDLKEVDGKLALANPDDAPLFAGAVLRGPVRVFNDFDLAFHRRKHLLELFEKHKTLTTGQMMRELKAGPVPVGSVTYETIRHDLQSLADRIRPTAHRGLWELFADEGKPQVTNGQAGKARRTMKPT